ncbi:hypothetical protein J7L67_10345, partial [bacterium]|nr:hypothetical protein [bacterium]
TDKSLFTEMNNRLVKIKDDLSDHWNTADFSLKKISGSGIGKKGVGKTKGETENKIEKISNIAEQSSEKIEFFKQGDNLDNSLEPELIKRKKNLKNYEPDISVVKNFKSGSVVYPDKISEHNNNKNDKVELIRLNGDIILNPVWIDTIAPDRQECVKKYFSAEDKIRSFNNEK